MALRSFDQAAPGDGRRRRKYATRQKIVSAAIALPEEGILHPSMDQISERAGISLRTAFHHFKKRMLTRAVLDELMRLYSFDLPDPELVKHNKLAARADIFLDLRIRKLEYLTPYRKASNIAIDASPALRKHRLKVRQRQ